jgi:Spy/CpxP family protein refolding chaperone
MKRILAAVLFTLTAIATSATLAQNSIADVTDMPALRAAVRADKKAYVASALNLTDAEAKKFWPLYAAYQRDVDLANRERSLVVERLIGRDKPLTDLYARDLAKELVLADEVEIKARRTLYNRLIKALPAKKAARYLQLESKIRAVQAYDIASAIPLVN